MAQMGADGARERWLPAARRGAAALSRAAWLLVVGGCSYAARITATNPTVEDAVSEKEVEAATAIVSRIAGEFGLTPCADPLHGIRVSADLGLRELACFSHEADRASDWSKVLLLTFVDEANQDEIVVLLRDWSSLRPTTFTDALGQRLMAGLSEALPNATVRFERVYDTPIFYAP